MEAGRELMECIKHALIVELFSYRIYYPADGTVGSSLLDLIEYCVATDAEARFGTRYSFVCF